MKKFNTKLLLGINFKITFYIILFSISSCNNSSQKIDELNKIEIEKNLNDEKNEGNIIKKITVEDFYNSEIDLSKNDVLIQKEITNDVSDMETPLKSVVYYYKESIIDNSLGYIKIIDTEIEIRPGIRVGISYDDFINQFKDLREMLESFDESKAFKVDSHWPIAKKETNNILFYGQEGQIHTFFFSENKLIKYEYESNY